MSKRRTKFCRYVPAVNGSPAWMSVEEAEEHLKRDIAYIERMIELCKDSPIDVAYWECKQPYIQYVTK